MFVQRILSLNNGWSILTTQKGEEWEEAKAVLNTLDDEFIIKSSRDSDGLPRSVDYTYNFLYYGYQQHIIDNYNWPDDALSKDNKIAVYSDDPPIKNGVLASLIGMDEITGGDFASTVYLHAPYYFTLGIIDVAVYFIASAEVIARVIEIGAKPEALANIPTEEFCRTEIAKLSTLTSRTPIVLAFFSPTAPEEIVVEEASFKASASVIERIIEFAPEHYQAGVGLLSYFGEILRQKDPNTKAKVRIEQEGNRVRLHIESPGGDIEIIEKELAQYALVVSQQAAPETLLANRAHIMQLETQLDITRIQVKQAQDLMQLAEGQYTQRINNLEKQLEFLQTQFAAQILQSGQVVQLVSQQAQSNERVQMALLAHGQLVFKDILEESRGNFQLLSAIQSLHQNLLSGLTTIDVEEQIKQALETVKQQKPGLLARIYSQVEGAALKAGAGTSLTWAANVFKHTMHPR